VEAFLTKIVDLRNSSCDEGGKEGGRKGMVRTLLDRVKGSKMEGRSIRDPARIL
jgi:hypothetical protein